MRRLLMPLAVVLLAAGVAAQDFRAAKEEFEGAFIDARPAIAREQAVGALSSFDDKDTVKLLLTGIPVSHEILEPLLARKAELDKELHGLIGDQMMEEKRTFPQEKHDQINKLKRESVGLQVRIDGEIKVLEAIAQSLASFRSAQAVEHLYASALLREKHWRARQMVAEALGEIAAPESAEHLARALRDKDDRVLVSVIVTLGRLRAAGALGELIDCLKDDAWTVRAAAIEALGQIGEKGAVKALIDQMAKEQGRLQIDCATALARLTGEKFGAAPEAWKRWWEEHKEEYGAVEEGKEGLGDHPAPPPGGSDGGYYGIPILTDRAIFILDVSGSMSGPSSGDANVTKIQSAKNELSRALRGFAPKGKFNLIVFNDSMKQWKDAMVPATKANKEDAQGWVKDLEAASSTNIYDAMDAAFRLAGMGARDKHYDLGADTIFLLSDGSPTTPDGQPDDWQKIIRAVREWNKLKRVVIHTIGIGGHNAAFMSTLASENNGTYVAR